MRKKPSRLADTVRMRAWRDRKGGTKPAVPPAAPTRLDTTAIYTHVSNERLYKIHADCHPRGRCRGLIELTDGGETARGPIECRQCGGGADI